MDRDQLIGELERIATLQDYHLRKEIRAELQQRLGDMGLSLDMAESSADAGLVRAYRNVESGMRKVDSQSLQLDGVGLSVGVRFEMDHGGQVAMAVIVYSNGKSKEIRSAHSLLRFIGAR